MFKKLLKQIATQTECSVRVTHTSASGTTVEAITTIVGTPDQIAREIERLTKLADGIANEVG